MSAKDADAAQTQEDPEMLRRLVHNSPGLAYRCLHDADWTLAFVSEGSTALLGYTPTQLVTEKVVAIPDRVHPDDLSRVSLAIEKAVSEKVPFQIVYRMRTASEQYKWISETGCGVFNDAGDLEALEGFLADITDHVESEQELRQAQRRDAVSRMASGIAHDFNNLLTAISASTENLGDELVGDELREELSTIESAVERAARLTDKLLRFGRPRTAANQPLDLSQVIRDLEPILKNALSREHTLDIELPKKGVICQLDATQLEQIVINLAVNARDAMPDSGHLAVSVEEDTTAKVARIRVADSGQGIEPDNLPLIFEPYFTTKATSAGSGLGLAMVRNIVESANGSIEAHSQVGEGTTFVMEFPLLSAMVADSPLSNEPRGTEVILYAEDDDDVRRATVRGLQRLGFTVLEAANGQQALKVSERHRGPIDLILTDAKMPVLGGINMTRQLREQRPNVPAVLISGDSIKPPADTFEVCLRKPMKVKELATHIRKLLDDPGEKPGLE